MPRSRSWCKSPSGWMARIPGTARTSPTPVPTRPPQPGISGPAANRRTPAAPLRPRPCPARCRSAARDYRLPTGFSGSKRGRVSLRDVCESNRGVTSLSTVLHRLGKWLDRVLDKPHVELLDGARRLVAGLRHNRVLDRLALLVFHRQRIAVEVDDLHLDFAVRAVVRLVVR